MQIYRQNALLKRSKNIFFLWIALIPGCSAPKEQSPAGNSPRTNAPSTEEKIFSLSDAQCSTTNCTAVKISYETVEGNVRFNKSVLNHIRDQMKDFVRDGKRLKTMEDIAQAFISDFREFKKAFPESRTPWDLTLSGSIPYQSKNLISYRMELFSYTGGAHPVEEVLLINFNENGKVVTLKSLMKDREKFMKIAEEAFRKEEGLSPDENFISKGITFENNRFSLPGNVGFDEKGIVILYNDYEIKAYHEGLTTLRIPYEQLKDLLTY